MEKYQNYRQEIAQSAKLGQSIVDSDKTISKFKKQIDEINPVILSSSPNETLTFVKGVTEISLKQKEIPVDVAKLFSTLNKAKSTYNKENVSLILFNMSNNTILDSNDNIKEQWLQSNADYASLVQYKKSLNFNPNSIEKTLEAKYADFIATNNTANFETLSMISAAAQKRASSYAFVISIAVAIIFFVLAFALLIVKMVS